jgi:hypothetical protein
MKYLTYNPTFTTSKYRPCVELDRALPIGENCKAFIRSYAMFASGQK